MKDMKKEMKVGKKIKLIFLFFFLLLTFGLGIAFSSVSFLSPNSGLFFSARARRPSCAKLGTYFTSIKPVLITLKSFNKSEIVFKIGSLGNERDYSVTNLIKDDITTCDSLSLEAQKELKLLHENDIDAAELTAAYKAQLDAFFILIKPYLQDYKSFFSKEPGFRFHTSVNILTNHLDKEGSKLVDVAKNQFIGLWATDVNGLKLAHALKNHMRRFFVVYRFELLLQDFKEINQPTSLVFYGKTYQIGNLIAHLDKAWETNTLARREAILLWQLSRSFSVSNIIGKTTDHLRIIRNQFMRKIRNILSILKAINVTSAEIGMEEEKQNYSWLELTKSANIGKGYDQLPLPAQIEFTKLLVNNITNEKLQTVYNLLLNNFLIGIKPALQTFKEMDASQVTIDSKLYSIGELTKTLATSGSKQGGKAKEQLLVLYNYNASAPTVQEKLQSAYKLLLNDFLIGIKSPLQVLKAMGSTEVTIAGKTTPFQISNLVNVLEKDDWETNALASKELAVLYKHNPIHSVVDSQLVIVYEGLLDSFLAVIKSTLQEFAVNKITEVWIDKKHYSIGDLILSANLDKKGSAQTGSAKTELFALYKYSVDVQKLQGKLNHFLVTEMDNKKILAFQKNWDAGEVPGYLLWLPMFDVQEVKLSQNKVVSVAALATAIRTMLTAEKFDFTKLEGQARKQLLNLLSSQGKLREAKTFQDDVWRQIKNHKKWKTVEGIKGAASLLLIRTLLLKVEDLGISKVSHPFFPEGYDLSFLQDNERWKEISFPELLQGMTVAVNGTNVEFSSHLFPDQIVFQVPMKKLSTVFSEITITNIIKILKKTISDYSQQKSITGSKQEDIDNNQQEESLEAKVKTSSALVIGLSVGGSVLALSTLGGFLYWFFKIKK